MASKNYSRRTFINNLVANSLGLGISANIARASEKNENENISNSNNYRYALNLGTLRHYQLTLMEELEIAHKAEYSSVEIWFDRLYDYAADNGKFSVSKLRDLKKFLDDNGLYVEGGIGFATWIMNEPEKRQEGLDEIKRQAEALAILGTPNIALPAAGPWNEKINDLVTIADRYRNALEITSSFGIRGLLEPWGTSPTLSRLSDCLAICTESCREDAGLLLDIYHLYRGNNSFSGLCLISGLSLPIIHLNDYPSSPRESLTDGDRLFPGDGLAPWSTIFSILKKIGFTGVLSLELFNESYSKTMTALEQAKLGLKKMRQLSLTD